MKAVLLTSSVLILALVLLRRLLRGHVSLRLQYALWLLVAVRLLVPVQLGQSSFSVTSLLDRAEDTAAVQAIENAGDLPLPPQSYEQAYAQMVEDYEAQGVDVATLTGSALEALECEAMDRMAVGPTLAEIAKAVWLAGIAVMAVWFLAVNLRFLRRARQDAQPLEVPDCPLPVLVSEHVPSPCLLGWASPTIYVTPACAGDPARLRHVLAHELTHFRHGDHWWSLVRCVCLCVYWFDPLVWWAAALSRWDCELACDEGAIRRLGESERFAYGRTLVDMVSASRVGLLQIATAMNNSKSQLRQRVALIAKHPQTRAAALFLTAAVVCLAVLCTFTEAKPSFGWFEALGELPAEFTEEDVEASGPWVTTGKDQQVSFHYDRKSNTSSTDDFRLLGVMRMSKEAFETAALESQGSENWTCFARDDRWYYTMYLENTFEEHRAVQSELADWVTSTVLAQEGVEAYSLSDFYGSYTYSGQHIDAAYYLYLAFDGTTDLSWTLTLSQPAAQGKGGIWCVERYTDWKGLLHLAGPETGDPAAYYARLQEKADAGEADWALDPMQVCLDFAHSLGGYHEDATEAGFFLSEAYGDAGSLASVLLAAMPEELQVGVRNKGEEIVRVTGESFPEGTVLSLYDWLLNAASSYYGPKHDMGWLCDLFYISPELLETELPHDGTWEIIAEDGRDGYYAILSAEGFDGDFAEECALLQTRVIQWLKEAVVQLPGVEAASIYKVYPDLSLSGAAKTAESALRHIMDGDTVVMTMTCVDGVGGGRYERDPSKANGPNRQLYFPTFHWTYSDSGLPPSPEPDRSLKIESQDGRYALQFWEGSEKVLYTSPEGVVWLAASDDEYGSVFDNSIFAFMRFWYDEAEMAGLRGDVVIPDQGQSYQEIAQAWVDATQGAKLKATPGSKYACTYMRNVVEVEEGALDGWYRDYMLETEHFYFSYDQIFVPENDTALSWMMAGNTDEYEGEYGDAPAGAFICYQMGPMYLTEAGWRCDGTGTGP